jgi:outer membrane protein assembly factor BamB
MGVVEMDHLSPLGPRTAVLVVLLVLLFMGLAVSVSATASMYRSDAEHTGAYDDGGSRPNGLLAWKAVTVDSGATVTAQPASVDNTVYFVDSHGYVYAVDAGTGTRKWVSTRIETNKALTAPAIADGYVITTGDGIYGLDAATGQLRWGRFPVPIVQSFDPSTQLTPATVWSGMAFVADVGNTGSRVVAYSTAGNEVWNRTKKAWAPYPGGFTSEIAVHQGTCYFADQYYFFIVDALSGGGQGQILYWKGIPEYANAPPAYLDGYLYRSFRGGVACQNAANPNHTIWFRDVADPYSPVPGGRYQGIAPVSIGDGRVFAAGGNSTHGKVWALNNATGERVWNLTVTNTPVSDRQFTLPVFANDVVYATGSNRLYALNAADGTSRWVYWNTSTALYSPPAVAMGKVLVGGKDAQSGALFAIGTQAGPAPTVAPIPGASSAPKDLDGNGKYEDVNGNGRKDFADVTLYFNRMTWIGENEPVAAFDYNGNGRIDFADVTSLFNGL